jgi:hypothetical protein
VRRCRLNLTQQLIAELKRLPSGQVRGYIRAYASDCVAAVASDLARTLPIGPAQISKAVHLATESLIEIVAQEVRSTPPIIVADVGDIAAAA